MTQVAFGGRCHPLVTSRPCGRRPTPRRARPDSLSGIRNGDFTTGPDIARRLGLQRQSVQRVADELVADGLARYEDNPRHRRSRLLVATAAGKSALAAIQSAHCAWVAEVAATVGELDWERLSVDLDRIAQAIGSHARHPG